MGVVLSLIGAVLAGLGGHQARPWLRRDFEGGWFPIATYASGLVLMSPFVAAFYLALGGDVRDTGRLVAAYFLAALGLGAGVTAGHYLQPDK